MQAVIPRLPDLYDEPFADASQIPTFLVSELARRDVTVALSGDGGDEVFGGYNRYVTGMRTWKRLSRVPQPARRGAVRVVEAIRPRTWDRAGKIVDKVLPAGRRGFVSGNRVHKLASVLGPELGRRDVHPARLDLAGTRRDGHRRDRAAAAVHDDHVGASPHRPSG